MKAEDYELNKTYWLSTEGYSFRYRNDRYNDKIIHVEMLKDGVVVHKMQAQDSKHHDVINELEARITLNDLDPTGLNQFIKRYFG